MTFNIPEQIIAYNPETDGLCIVFDLKQGTSIIGTVYLIFK